MNNGRNNVILFYASSCCQAGSNRLIGLKIRLLEVVLSLSHRLELLLVIGEEMKR